MLGLMAHLLRRMEGPGLEGLLGMVEKCQPKEGKHMEVCQVEMHQISYRHLQTSQGHAVCNLQLAEAMRDWLHSRGSRAVHDTKRHCHMPLLAPSMLRSGQCSLACCKNLDSSVIGLVA